MENDYNRAIVCYTYEVNILHKHISNGKKQGLHHNMDAYFPKKASTIAAANEKWQQQQDFAVCACEASVSLMRALSDLMARCQGSGMPPRPPSQPSDVESQFSQSATTSPPQGQSPSPSQVSTSIQPVQPVPVLKRIPKAARQQCLAKFQSNLGEVVRTNSVAAWERLLHFPTRCL